MAAVLLRFVASRTASQALVCESRTMSDDETHITEVLSSEDDSSYMSADDCSPSHSSAGDTLLLKAQRHAKRSHFERALSASLEKHELPKTGRALVERLKALAAFAA